MVEIEIFKKIIDDILLVIGIAFICFGVFQIYIPAGYIVTGLGIIGIAQLVARLVARNGPEGR